MWIHRQIALILAAALAGPALAADNSSWTNLSTLKHGTRIGIIQSDMKRVEGLFEGFDYRLIAVSISDSESNIDDEFGVRQFVGKALVCRIRPRRHIYRGKGHEREEAETKHYLASRKHKTHPSELRCFTLTKSPPRHNRTHRKSRRRLP